MESVPGEVTLVLQQVRDGQEGAEDRLIALVYKDLKRRAANYLRRESPDNSLQPTALVHDAYLSLTRRSADWENRSHFFKAAARAMRNILIDHARARRADKRGRGLSFVELDEKLLPSPVRRPEIVALDDALERLEKFSPRQYQTVELKWFSGLTEDEIADIQKVSSKTVQRDWRHAQAWLAKELSPRKRLPAEPNNRGALPSP